MTDPTWGRHWKAREITLVCYEAGWIDAVKLCTAVAVVIAESNGYEKRRNHNPAKLNADGSVRVPASIDRGGWAINDVAHPDVSDEEADDFPTATAIARRLYVAHGGSFRPTWSSVANGQYLGPRAWGYAAPGVGNFLLERVGLYTGP